MKRKLWRALVVVALLASLFGVLPALAVHPVPDDGPVPDQPGGSPGAQVDDYAHPIDEPNPAEEARLLQRERLLNAGQTAEAAALAKTGTDRVIVILVEFAGTDVFTWTAPTNPLTPSTGSTWDPIGKADTNEWNGSVGDCSRIITQTRVFTYGPTLHNQMPRPLSASAAATLGRRTLLVDCFVDAPRLHTVVGAANDEGIVDAFEYGASLTRIAQRQAESDLYFVPAGTFATDPSALMANRRWSRLAAGFRHEGALLLLYTSSAALPYIIAETDAVLVLAPDEYRFDRDAAGGLVEAAQSGRPLVVVVPGAAAATGPGPRDAVTRSAAPEPAAPPAAPAGVGSPDRAADDAVPVAAAAAAGSLSRPATRRTRPRFKGLDAASGPPPRPRRAIIYLGVLVVAAVLARGGGAPGVGPPDGAGGGRVRAASAPRAAPAASRGSCRSRRGTASRAPSPRWTRCARTGSPASSRRCGSRARVVYRIHAGPLADKSSRRLAAGLAARRAPRRPCRQHRRRSCR